MGGWGGGGVGGEGEESRGGCVSSSSVFHHPLLYKKDPAMVCFHVDVDFACDIYPGDLLLYSTR